VATATCRPAFSRPDWRALARLIAAAAWLLPCTGAAVQQVALNIDRIDGAYFSLSGVSIALHSADTSSLGIRIAEVTGVGFDWRNVRVACPDLRQERDDFVCERGTLEAPDVIPLSFRYAARGDRLDLALRPGDGEEWRVLVEPGPSGHTLTFAIERGQLERRAEHELG